jgi:hypothetical protein
MGLLDPTRDFERVNLRHSEYEGYVVDVNDPKKRQRVRIRVPMLHRGIPDNKLPWVNQRSAQANAGGGVGAAAVPDKGAKVIYKHLENDPHAPQYGQSVTSDDVNKDNELLNEDYPNTVGHVDSHGNRWSTNKSTGDVTMVHKSGATISIDGGGNISIGSAGDLSLAAKGTVTIGGQGGVKINSGGAIDIAGSTIGLNDGAAGSINIPSARSSPTIPDRTNKTTL